MKVTLAACLIGVSLPAQILPTVGPVGPLDTSGGYRMLDRGLHYKIWARSTLVTNEAGIVRYRTNAYTELHTGVSFRNPDTGLLEDSSPDFVITPQGCALASKCQHRLIVSADASDPEGVIDCQMPDGSRLRSRLAGLYLFSPVTGKSLQIAAPKSCAAEQTAPNEITFPDVLDGMLKASLRIRNERGGYHHDLLLNERFSDAQIEKLAALGFDSNMRLEVWSEFLESPSPAVQEAVVRTEAKASVFAEPNTYDALIDFGTMRLGLGRSFVDGEDGDDCARVSKQWLRIQQRSFLIEGARFSDLAPLMDRLPASTMTVKNSKLDTSRLLAGRIPPPKTDQANKELSAQNKSHLQVARFDPAKRPQTSPRLVVDYSVLNGTITNLTLHSEGTWFVTGPVNVSGTLEFLPGCVVKFTNSPVVLMGASNIVCRTGPYAVGVLTSWCDDSVGETIPQSTGNPTNYNAGTYLQEQWFWNTNAIKYLRFLYAGTALHFKPRDGIWHCQFVNCDKAVSFTIDSTLWLHNVLFSGCFNAIHGSGVRINGEHLTVDGTYFNRSPCVVCITNSIFIGATSTGDLYFDTYHFATNSTRDGVFQALGAANYYLASNSENRFKGRTEINPILLADLKQRSTYPPALYYQTNVSGSLIFHPRNEPTNSQPPDLGYAYDRLDYLVCGLVLTNAALTISPGTAIASYQTNQIGYGIGLGGGAQLFCDGSPTNFVQVTVYNTVQEQPIQPTSSGWRIPGFSVYDTPGTPRSARFRFTDWSRTVPQGNPGFEHLQVARTIPFAISDCHFHSGMIEILSAPVQLTNCLFEHAWIDLEPGLSSTVTEPSFIRNNLFIGGIFSFWSSETNSLIADNLFDGTAINFLGATFNASFNAFVTNCDRLWPTNETDIVLPASPQYQSGPLGDYYQLASSVLINADTNTTADQVGLYHYTTTTNIVDGAQIKETNSWVDVGLHYVALDSSGSPVDTDGGGVPDFIENGAGDGNTNNVTESNWRYQPDDFKYLLTPQYLRVEYRENPWGVDARDPLQGGTNQRPRFFWVVDSSRRAQKQLAYQIIVGANASGVTNGDVGDMWDSGKVYSDQTIHVEYDDLRATPLASGQRLWWKVRVWDPYTGIGKWGTNGAFFQMGLLSTNDWKASWLTTSNGVDVSRVSPIYRKQFAHPTNDIVEATAYVSAKGVYDFYLDGHRIGANLLAPEWTDYNVRIQYQVYDVTAALMSTNSDGTNHVMGAVVAEGWYSGSAGRGDIWRYQCGGPNPNYQRYTNCTAMRGRNQLLVQLAIKRTDGTITNIITDTSWTCSTNGPIRLASVDNGETYAATNETAVSNWAVHGGQIASFTNPVATDIGFAARLVAQPSDPIQLIEHRHPIDVWTNTNELGQFVRIFDMGQNIEGWCILYITNTSQPSGTPMVIRHASRLALTPGSNAQTRGANINRDNLKTGGDIAEQADTYYILSTNGVQELQPHFTYHSFRYVEVAATNAIYLDTSSVIGCVIRSSTPEVGAFLCSNRDINQLVTNILWTLKANLYGVFSACSDRCERSGWLGDTDVFSQTACLLMDMAAIYTKCVRDIRDDQWKDEYFVDCGGGRTYYRGAYMPNNPWAGRAVGDIGTEVGGVIKPWQLYQNYGDIRALEEHYVSATNWVNWLSTVSPLPGLTQWSSGGAACDGDQFAVVPTLWEKSYATMDALVYVACSYAYSADIVAGMATNLHQLAQSRGDYSSATKFAQDADYYSALATSIRSYFQTACVNYDLGEIVKVGNRTQGDYVYALYFNMVPQNQRSNCVYWSLHDPDRGIFNYNHRYTREPQCTNDHLSTGIFATGRAMQELTRNGYTDLAYQLLTDSRFPSWLYQVTNGGAVYNGTGNYGATTIWERWNGWVSGGNGGYEPPFSSFCQVWNGSVGEWIFGQIGGIARDENAAAFQNVLVYPRPGGGITNAWAKFNSIHGGVICSWTETRTNLSLAVTVPANVTASVCFSASDLTKLWEGGQAATNAIGLLHYDASGGTARFDIGSGDYCFSLAY